MTATLHPKIEGNERAAEAMCRKGFSDFGIAGPRSMIISSPALEEQPSAQERELSLDCVNARRATILIPGSWGVNLKSNSISRV